MPSEVTIKNIAEGNFSITLASLANNAGRASASIDNSSNDYPAALVAVNIKSGASTPTAGKAYFVYLLRDTGTLSDDGWDGTDSAFTPENSPVLGSIRVTATASKDFVAIFDTSILGPLGPTWGIGVFNKSGQAISSSESDHDYHYTYYVPEQQ